MSGVRDMVMELFDEYAAAYAAGERPDVLAFLERAGSDADRLERLVDVYLQSAPLQGASEAELALVEARAAGEPALFVLRRRLRLQMADVGRRLAEALGHERAAARVERRYQELELDRLDPSLVAEPVWSALRALFGTDVRGLVSAAKPLPPAPSVAASAVYSRLVEKPEWAVSLDAAAPSPGQSVEDEDADAVDRLFGVG